MSAAIVTLTLRLDRHDHSRKLTDESLMELAEGELDGTDWWDGDYRYEVTVTSASVEVNERR